ncbi:hypothetical protein GOODEAATRI_003864 [Goodea atripinnis]|uniref:Sodium/myo-inositol cotransporter n=1 Tax=Goodea atripinnis TaxID=208336 RepID=A0ABV0NRK8_9TELE
MATNATMEAADIVVVVVYFILVLGIGFLAMRKANQGTVSGYFLAGRSMNWAAVGASLFVSNIGSEHFIGLAGSGAASGFSVAAWEFNALLLLQLLGWVFIPVYIQCGVYTMPEYLYWCTDQVIVQRVLAAKNIGHAKGSTIMAGFLKILPMFIIVIPGMISRVFFADELACISPEHCMEVCGSAAGCSNMAYPRLVVSLMPVGCRGLMMAVMIAALMSDLDSIFNSASTIFTLDIYKMLRKEASSKELVITGRLFVIFMVTISIAWVPVIIEMQGGQMFYYIQEVCDYLTPPVAAQFLLGILWHRCNETGAFWGGVVGLSLGALRLILGFVYREPHCDQPDERPSFIKDIHFMYVAAFLFWVSALVIVVVSLYTPPPEKEQIGTTTLWGLKQRRKQKTPEIEQGKEDLNNLNLLDHTTENGNGVVGEETFHGHKNKLNSTDCNNENTQSTSSYIIPAHSPLQNGCYNLSEARLENEGEMREGKDVEGGEECHFGREGVLMENGKCMNIFECICGLQEKSSQTQVITAQEQEKIVDELLYEPPGTKMILNTLLVLICSIGIFLFGYFSL